MYDALTRIAQTEQRYMAFSRIGLKIAHHSCDFGIGDGVIAAACRYVMIRNTERQSGLRDRATARLHLTESMERAFMHIVAIDPEQGRPVVAPHDLVRGPQLVDQGLGLTHMTGSSLTVAALSRVGNIVNPSSRTLNNQTVTGLCPAM